MAKRQRRGQQNIADNREEGKRKKKDVRRTTEKRAADVMMTEENDIDAEEHVSEQKERQAINWASYKLGKHGAKNWARNWERMDKNVHVNPTRIQYNPRGYFSKNPKVNP